MKITWYGEKGIPAGERAAAEAVIADVMQDLPDPRVTVIAGQLPIEIRAIAHIPDPARGLGKFLRFGHHALCADLSGPAVRDCAAEIAVALVRNRPEIAKFVRRNEPRPMRLFLKTSWSIEPRNGGFILTETTKATGAAATGSIEFGPFETRAKAEAYATIRQEGMGEMLARMRAQITLAMREERAA